MAIITGVGAAQADSATGIIHSMDDLKYVPYETFEMVIDGETCVHVKDMPYTIRGDNKTMRDLVSDWISTGKVKRIG